MRVIYHQSELSYDNFVSNLCYLKIKQEDDLKREDEKNLK